MNNAILQDLDKLESEKNILMEQHRAHVIQIQESHTQELLLLEKDLNARLQNVQDNH